MTRRAAGTPTRAGWAREAERATPHRTAPHGTAPHRAHRLTSRGCDCLFVGEGEKACGRLFVDDEVRDHSSAQGGK